MRPRARSASHVPRRQPSGPRRPRRVRRDAALQGITGHSTGGHGALTLHLKHPGLYRSVSAFAPIATPSEGLWGQKAFGAYLNEDRQAWKARDASALVRASPSGARIPSMPARRPSFPAGQLRPARFKSACEKVGRGLDYRLDPDRDHLYWTVASFVGEHIDHHADALDR